MNKKIIITIVFIALILTVIVVSYVITKNINVNDKVSIPSNNITENNEKNKDNEETKIDKYKEIDINSKLANEVFTFVPKYFQTMVNKMNDEYIIYSALSNLEEKNQISIDYNVGDGTIPGYKSNLVEEAAKNLYGENTVISKKEKYNLPIVYNKTIDAFCKLPMGFGSQEENQVIKSLKENDKQFILQIYALNIEYDVEDLNHVYIATKETFKMYENKVIDETKMRATMKKYNLNGTQVEPISITSMYKDELPVIEYTITKLDKRGLKYFVKDIKYIY
ncbi:MAG: hypothetical protein RR290_03055 [Clostridia bacterium]